VPDSIRWYADGGRNAAAGSDAAAGDDVVAERRDDEGHDEEWYGL